MSILLIVVVLGSPILASPTTAALPAGLLVAPMPLPGGGLWLIAGVLGA